jgi:co-chaperonin GroES (HSP10)
MWRVPLSFHKATRTDGVQVLYGRYSGQELEEDDTTYVVVREPEILAVLSK